MRKAGVQDRVGIPVAEPEEEKDAGFAGGAARAGIDLGSQLRVCAPNADGKGREVGTFGVTTAELERMAAWLRERKVETIAPGICLADRESKMQRSSPS